MSPHGTCESHSTTFAFFSVSSTPVMPAGLSAGTTITIEFVATTLGSFALPASTAFFMFFWSAEINKSPGAPSASCCTKFDEPPLTYSKVCDGVRSAASFDKSSLTTRVEAAPNTVNFTDSAVVLLPGDDVVEPELELPLQAAAVIMIAAPNATTVASKRTGLIDIPSIGNEIQAPDHRASLSNCFLLERMGSHAGL